MTQEERERLRAEFLRKASEGFDWMFDPNRQEDMRTFTQREDRAMDIGTGLAQWALERPSGRGRWGPAVAGRRHVPAVPWRGEGAGGFREREARGREPGWDGARRAAGVLLPELPPPFFSRWTVTWGWARRATAPRWWPRSSTRGGNTYSFEQASEVLAMLARHSFSAKHVQRVTERVGKERAGERDAQVAKLRAGTLLARQSKPPRVVAIHIDGGKLQLRDDDAAPGVHHPRWGDTKVAALVSYTTPEITQDPQPEPPAAPLDRGHVARLCAEMERVRNAPTAMPPKAPAPETETEAAVAATTRPRVLVKTAVATRRDTEAFGWMVAAEAKRRGFCEAMRAAVVGDGGNWIDPLGALHFPGFTQVLDFLHLLVHLYAAAMAAHAKDGVKAWSLYDGMLRAAWAGRVGDVLMALEGACAALGPPRKCDPEDHPRRVARRVTEYVRTNRTRMDYPRYRCEGLPSSSALIESLIKQLNQRVKGSEKFWTQPGAEAVLQVRAAYLSDDDRKTAIYGTRAALARAVGAGRLRAVA